MAHLWFQSDQVWNVFALAENSVALSAEGPVEISPDDESDHNGGVLIRSGNGGWTLLAGVHGEARVNGLAFPGIRVLRDRDEIRVLGQTVFFSTERLASVEAYPGSSKAFCPRCRQEIAMQGVQCPGCGVWYHEAGKLNCWTYAGNCALCPQKTEFSGTYQWTPEAM